MPKHKITNFKGFFNVLTQNSTVEEVVEFIKIYTPNLIIEFVDSSIMNQLSYEVSNTKFVNTGFTFMGDLQNSIEDTIKLLPNK